MDADHFRELLSHWASTVGIVAVRDQTRVHGTTVSSFTPVAADPPVVLVALGPNAQALPFLQEGTRYVVNLLHEGQRALAEIYADPFPVGASPFPATGDPVITDALIALVCEAVSVVEVDGGARLVLGRVLQGDFGGGERPLIWHRRAPTRLTTGDL